MPKKKNPETQEQQSERFKAEVERLIAAGDLNPTEADQAFERVMGHISSQPTPPISDSGG